MTRQVVSSLPSLVTLTSTTIARIASFRLFLSIHSRASRIVSNDQGNTSIPKCYPATQPTLDTNCLNTRAPSRQLDKWFHDDCAISQGASPRCAVCVASSIVINTRKLMTISKCPYLCACFCSSRYWAKGIAPMARPSPNDREKLPVVTYPMIPSDGGGI